MTQASRSGDPSGRLAALSRHALARSWYCSEFQLSGIRNPYSRKFQSLLIPAAGKPDQIATKAEPSDYPSRWWVMTVRELRAKALHYRRIAGLVTDETVAEGLLELAADYASLADKLEDEPTPGAAEQ